MSAEDDIFNGIPAEFLDNDGPFFVEEKEPKDEIETKIEEEKSEESLVFDDAYKADFQKLMTLGKLTATFKWTGHTFRIKTIKNRELLQIGQLHQPYLGTMSDVRAYTTILAAACLETVDGKPLPLPLTRDDEELETKFNYINDQFYSWTIDAIYTKYLELEARVQEILEAMGKA